MELGTAFITLVATLAGGVITVLGQIVLERQRETAAASADIRKEQAVLKAAKREVAAQSADRSRSNVADLSAHVWSDVADLRAAAVSSDDAGNTQRMEILHGVSRDASRRLDLAQSLIVRVSDEAVRDAAKAVYKGWGLWAASESESLANGVSNNVDADVALQSGESFAGAVRTYLDHLDTKEIETLSEVSQN